MDREKFIKDLNQNNPPLSKEEIMKILTKSIDANLPDGNPRGHRNLIIVMEELAELSKEISKALRDKGDYYSLLEELADVQLCIYYIQEICGVADEELKKAMDVKTNRLREVLEKEGKFL